MPRDIYPELGAAVRSAREHAGMTQAELAERVGLSRTSITNIERGRQVVLVHHLIELSAALGTTAADLLPGPSRAGRGDGGAKAFADLSVLVRGLANYDADPVP